MHELFVWGLQYYSEEESIDADKVTLSDLTYENIIRFLEWLQEHQHNSISSRNQKQAAINSFIRYMSVVSVVVLVFQPFSLIDNVHAGLLSKSS